MTVAPSVCARAARIMIVDGDPGSLRRSSDALLQHGYLVERAFDAAQAQRLLEYTIPNLILAAAGLPGIDSLARRRERLAGGKLRHVPIIALTACADGAAPACGAEYDGCINAPVGERELAMLVAAFLVRGPARRDGETPVA